MAPRAVREIRCVTRHRQDLAGQRRSTKIRLRAVLRDQRVKGPGTPWSKAWMSWLAATDDLSEQARWVVDRLLAQIDWLAEQIREAERRLEGDHLRRSDRETSASAARHRTGHGLDHAGGDRALRPVRQRQAALTVLRAEPAQRLQRRAAGRRRPGQGWQRAAAHGADRGGASSGQARSEVDRFAQRLRDKARREASWPPPSPTGGFDGSTTR